MYIESSLEASILVVALTLSNVPNKMTSRHAEETRNLSTLLFCRDKAPYVYMSALGSPE